MVSFVKFAIVAWAWLGIMFLVLDAERWPRAVRVVSLVCYSAVITIAAFFT